MFEITYLAKNVGEQVVSSCVEIYYGWVSYICGHVHIGVWK